MDHSEELAAAMNRQITDEEGQITEEKTSGEESANSRTNHC